eukprot:PhM_4_TR15373/c0_g1_i1/m.14465
MLQCGGSTNVSSALLKEVFRKERRVEDKLSRTIASNGSGKSRSRTLSPRKRGASPEKVPTYELPNKGIGSGVPVPQTPRDVTYGMDTTSPTKDTNYSPRHGRAPPYNRKDMRRGMYDTLSGGVSCLNPPTQSSVQAK